MSPTSSAPDSPHCDTMPGQVILSEPSGRWAVALRRELGPLANRVEETRTLIECWSCLAESPESLLVVEVTPGNLERLLAKMVRLEREFPRARIVVVADRRLANHEWLMREAGAAMFVISPRRLGPLADLARRHLAAQSGQTISTQDRILSSLPWAKHSESN